MDLKTEEMLEQIRTVERLAHTNKLGRLLHHPYRYLSSVFFKNLIYPRFKKEKEKTARLFNGYKMTVALPSATDIYLTGGKSHDSEIRLAKFLIRTLKARDHFLDIGAHYGYFSLIASDITGPAGKIIAIEPATKTFSILHRNCKPHSNITVMQHAISDTAGSITFYEFPNLFSEYNSVDASQFEHERWFNEFKPVKTTVAAITVNEITAGDHFHPAVIKIDVEGAELKVIQGGMDFFSNKNPVIALEYLSPLRGNTEHIKAVALLKNTGYDTYVINKEGHLVQIVEIEQYLSENNLESDNIILKKSS